MQIQIQTLPAFSRDSSAFHPLSSYIMRNFCFYILRMFHMFILYVAFSSFKIMINTPSYFHASNINLISCSSHVIAFNCV
jgi:hypothetical protein